MSGVAISLVQNALDTQPRNISVEKVLEAIRTGGKKVKGPIIQIRNRFEAELAITGGDRKAAKMDVDALKKRLPAVLWSGTFFERKNEKIVAHSGLLCADLDSLGDQLPKVRQELQKSPHVRAMFISPTGDGLKIVFRVSIDASKHAGSFRAVEKHVRDLTGIRIDQACKDVARLCFMSYDPDLYHNPNAIEIEPLPEPEKPKPAARIRSDGSKPDKEQIRQMLSVIPKRPDYPDWIKIVAAVGDALNDDDAIEVLNEWSAEEQPGEYADKLQHRLNEVHIGTLIHLACANGWRSQPETTPRVEAQSNGDVESVELLPALEPYTPPPFDLLPSQLQEYVYAAAESLNVDESFILLPSISSLGTAIGNSRSIILKPGFIQPPVIWTATIGRSGSRKSPGLEAGCIGVMKHERELIEQNKQVREQYENELAEWQGKKPKGLKPELPTILTCAADDLTIEALSYLLITNPRGVLIRKDELSHWFGSFDQYKSHAKGSDVSRWLSLHTGFFLAVDRVNEKRHYRIRQPRVCITGGIQPQVLRRILTEDFFERGLPARFLFAYPPFRQDKWSDAAVPEDIKNAALNLFGELWLLQPETEDSGETRPKLLALDTDAKVEYVAFYNECGSAAGEADEHGEAAYGKLTAYAARFALVGQLARDPNAEVVTGETMRAACDLARWCANEAVRIYASLAETPEQRLRRQLIEFIERRGGVVYEREVMQSFTRLKNNKQATERELTALVKAGIGKWESVDHGGGPGRPARKFRLLRSSTSTQFGISRGKTSNSVDVDRRSSQKITRLVESNTEAVFDALDAMPTGLLEL